MLAIFSVSYTHLDVYKRQVSDASLAGAVSKAGGLGIIAAANAPADYVREQIHLVKSQTDKPFGVNVMLMSPYCEDIAKLVIEEHVPVVVTGAGLPTKYMKDWIEAGIKVIPVVHVSYTHLDVYKRQSYDGLAYRGYQPCKTFYAARTT